MSAEWLVALAVVGLLAVPVVTLVGEGTQDHAQPVATHLSENSTDPVGSLNTNQLGVPEDGAQEQAAVGISAGSISVGSADGSGAVPGASMGVGVPIESGAFRNELGVDTAPVTVRQPGTAGPSIITAETDIASTVFGEGLTRDVTILSVPERSESKIEEAAIEEEEELEVADSVIRPDLIDVDLDDGTGGSKRSKDKTKDISVGAKNAVKFKF